LIKTMTDESSDRTNDTDSEMSLQSLPNDQRQALVAQAVSLVERKRIASELGQSWGNVDDRFRRTLVGLKRAWCGGGRA